MPDNLETGSRWMDLRYHRYTSKEHPRSTGENQVVRVMAVAEGYVMARFKGRIPFVISKRKFLLHFDPF